MGAQCTVECCNNAKKTSQYIFYDIEGAHELRRRLKQNTDTTTGEPNHNDNSVVIHKDIKQKKKNNELQPEQQSMNQSMNQPMLPPLSPLSECKSIETELNEGLNGIIIADFPSLDKRRSSSKLMRYEQDADSWDSEEVEDALLDMTKQMDYLKEFHHSHSPIQ